MASQVVATGRSVSLAVLEAELMAEYCARTPTSETSSERAKRVLPGGDTRTVAFHPPYPLTVVDGSGCRFTDVDGNEYIDVLNNYTSLIHGHAHPAIVAAVTEQLGKGTSYATAIAAQTQLAELLAERVASVDLIRFTNSGTEATMNAIRAARAFTGRDVIVKMEGGYHGTYDDVEISVHPPLDDDSAGPDQAPGPTLDTRGVPANTTENVLIVPFNDETALKRTILERGDEIAAVIVEPVLGSAGIIPANQSFLDLARTLTAEQGIVLIFDEVMTFRLEPGGVQEHYRIRPDLTTFAKIIGGGFPVGAFGGRAAIMEQYNPNRPGALSQSGTFNGNAVTMVAGIVAMEHFPSAEVQRINRLGDRLREGLKKTLAASGIVGQVTGYGSMVGLHFSSVPVTDYRSAARGDDLLKRAVHLGLLNEGVFAAPRLMFCTSTAMSEHVVDDVLGRFERVLVRVASAH
jgi:glutamate-1-semialdehyde 2,1-aminomutase